MNTADAATRITMDRGGVRRVNGARNTDVTPEIITRANTILQGLAMTAKHHPEWRAVAQETLNEAWAETVIRVVEQKAHVYRTGTPIGGIHKGLAYVREDMGHTGPEAQAAIQILKATGRIVQGGTGRGRCLIVLTDDGLDVAEMARPTYEEEDEYDEVDEDYEVTIPEEEEPEWDEPVGPGGVVMGEGGALITGVEGATLTVTGEAPRWLLTGAVLHNTETNAHTHTITAAETGTIQYHTPGQDGWYTTNEPGWATPPEPATPLYTEPTPQQIAETLKLAIKEEEEAVEEAAAKWAEERRAELVEATKEVPPEVKDWDPGIALVQLGQWISQVQKEIADNDVRTEEAVAKAVKEAVEKEKATPKADPALIKKQEIRIKELESMVQQLERALAERTVSSWM